MTDNDPPFDLTGALPFDQDADAQTPQKPGAAVLGERDFAYIGRALTVAEFAAYVTGYHFGTTPPDYVIIHHSAIPSTLYARYPSGAVWDAGEGGMSVEQIKAKRLKQLGKLRDYYRDTLGWNAGPHLFIDERWIYLMTPMAQVGIHAAQGNSYNDSRGRLHYSIGLEAIGYYEKLRWPPAVAANVRAAVGALKQTLQTFDYIDKPWAGGISAHRHYNKPACPGAAITPDYYMPLLKAADAPVPVRYPLYTVTSPCAVLTSRAPNAPLASGPDDGQTWLSPGDVVQMGEEKDGWLWVSDAPEAKPGIGFIPASYARPNGGTR